MSLFQIHIILQWIRISRSFSCFYGSESEKMFNLLCFHSSVKYPWSVLRRKKTSESHDFSTGGWYLYFEIISPETGCTEIHPLWNISWQALEMFRACFLFQNHPIGTDRQGQGWKGGLGQEVTIWRTTRETDNRSDLCLKLVCPEPISLENYKNNKIIITSKKYFEPIKGN